MTATAHHLQHTTAPVVTDNTKILSENRVIKQFHHKPNKFILIFLQFNYLMIKIYIKFLLNQRLLSLLINCLHDTNTHTFGILFNTMKMVMTSMTTTIMKIKYHYRQKIYKDALSLSINVKCIQINTYTKNLTF